MVHHRRSDGVAAINAYTPKQWRRVSQLGNCNTGAGVGAEAYEGVASVEECALATSGKIPKSRQGNSQSLKLLNQRVLRRILWQPSQKP
eukprot:CAMPEP_0181534308 /NCGR_PEP_ID=MMETSP1110-20121109/73657_1 /TAXON_ID=174948 /ORGANISM="Symbiodinium sp., Strain CCMP421" /LENGTH=88 /DNA_ID=CAMNT_0023665621 /DNA_START=280 /DNA_END=546 /DNA_ORIENTATION=+